MNRPESDRGARLHPRGYYGRPSRNDRIDPFDGALMGHCAGLVVFGVVMGILMILAALCMLFLQTLFAFALAGPAGVVLVLLANWGLYKFHEE